MFGLLSTRNGNTQWERGDLDRRGDLSPGVACCYWEVGLKDDED